MARTESTMLELGSKAADFALPEPKTGNIVSLSDFADQPLLVVFACNHCPYVLHVIQQFSQFAATYRDRGLSIVWINANDVEHFPDDSPQKMVELARQYNFNFPYLYDESQQVASTYRAACTPDFFLFDEQHQLVYRGQFDGSRPGIDVAVSGEDLINASEALLNHREQASQQIPSLGCNIKWKAGQEPDYF